MTETTRPKPPAGSGDQAADLWTSVHERYALNPGELHLLTLACRALDKIETLDGAAAEYVLRTNAVDQDYVNPAIPELRQWLGAFARLMGQLKLPDAIAPSNASHEAAAADITSKARAAANARWAKARGGSGAAAS